LGGALEVLQIDSLQINDVSSWIAVYFLRGDRESSIEIFIETVGGESSLSGGDLEGHFEAISADVPFCVEVGDGEILLEHAIRPSCYVGDVAAMPPIFDSTIITAVPRNEITVIASTKGSHVVSADVVASLISVGGIEHVAEVAGAGEVSGDGDEVFGCVTDLTGDDVVIPSSNQASGVGEAESRGHVLGRLAQAGTSG